MKQNVNKYPTGIPGLDELFYGGIQLSLSDDGESDKRFPSAKSCSKPHKGAIILIRGPRGIGKTLLAMQMMHGLTKSIYREYQKYQNCVSCSAPLFYSFNKNWADLQDMLLDMLISKQIYTIMQEAVRTENSIWTENILGGSLFNLEAVHGGAIHPPQDYRQHIDKYICERTVFYNSRTNALHFRWERESDDVENILGYRKWDEIGAYCEPSDGPLSRLPDNIREDFFNVLFNAHENARDADTQVRQYAHSILQKYQAIMEHMMCHTEVQAASRCGDVPRREYCPCIVLDGLAQFSSDDLMGLPVAELEQTLRSSALVSILVGDERWKEVKCNADIVIEMCQRESTDPRYMLHELQICKSVFQMSSWGWHRYKPREFGIEVFPSIHRLLQRRYYLYQRFSETHQSLLHTSYEEYLRTMQNMGGPLSYDAYAAGQSNRENALLKDMYYRQYRQFKAREKQQSAAKGKRCNVLDRKEASALLNKILLNPSYGASACPKTNGDVLKPNMDRWKGHPDITAMIGNPNSFKRTLTNAGVFDAAKHGEHTLIILFDKDEADMRRQVVCPGLTAQAMSSMSCFCSGDLDLVCEACADASFCKLKGQCRKCYKNIHFLGFRMGCITVDELFAVFKQQIAIPFKDGKRVSRIVVDDLQKIDYCFPLLKNEQLFLPTFINLCRDYSLKAHFLCDKQASLVGALCSLADNVVCLKRDEADWDSVTVYIERNAEHLMPSEIYKYNIKNMVKQIKCSDKMTINFSSAKRIGSMKEYWRRTQNVIIARKGRKNIDKGKGVLSSRSTAQDRLSEDGHT